MSLISRSLLATAAIVAVTWNIPAHALSMHECSVKYRAAQTAKTLNGMSWKDFRKADCGAGAAAATAPAAPSALNTAEPSKSKSLFNTAPTGDSTSWRLTSTGRTRTVSWTIATPDRPATRAET